MNLKAWKNIYTINWALPVTINNFFNIKRHEKIENQVGNLTVLDKNCNFSFVLSYSGTHAMFADSLSILKSS